MKLLLSALRKYWKAAAVAAAAALSLLFMRPNAYKDVTQELIALFGLMMAGVLPTMVLTASALRAGNLSVRKLSAYRDALFVQMKVWIGLFIVSLIASSLVILGKMIGWSLPLTIPLGVLGWNDLSYDFISVVNALVTGCLALVILRGLAVGSGIASLLRLSAEIALSEARLRDEDRHRAGDEALGRLPERPGFGEYVELKQ
jgi:hypothetical protein